MKESSYNYFVKYEPANIFLGYNCVSGGLIVFPGEQYDEINKILKEPDKADASILKEKLIKSRFLIDDDLDELKILKLRNNTARFNPMVWVWCLHLLFCAISIAPIVTWIEKEPVKMNKI